jgi:hypothetical protein
MPKLNERQCLCGCGTWFVPGSHLQVFVNRSHQLRGNRGLAEAQKRITELEEALARFSVIKPEDMRTPKWLKMPKGKRRHHATPVLMLSDLHLDEVVDKYEMDGANEYDRAIAEARLEQIVYGVVKLLRRFISGVEIDGLFLAMLGDIVTGIIHDELARTNEAPVPDTIVHWVPLIASAIKFLADELDVPIHVACVDGNHDRLFKQVPAKQRATSSLAWVIYNWLADSLRDDPRITFGLTTSAEQIVPVYDTKLLLSHGDSFRSAGGVGGLYPSLLKWLLRRHDYYSSVSHGFDYALIGHWHQPLWGQDFVVNGSLKGYDEYAKQGGFKFNVPSQQLFVVTPERGMTQRLEVFAA